MLRTGSGIPFFHSTLVSDIFLLTAFVIAGVEMVQASGAGPLMQPTIKTLPTLASQLKIRSP